MKSEIEDKEHREAEIKILKAKTKQRALEVKKRKDILRGVARIVCDAESIDLAFVTDFTCSMNTTIEAVRGQIREVMRRLKATNSYLVLRLALVAYRGRSRW